LLGVGLEVGAAGAADGVPGWIKNERFEIGSIFKILVK
jgi:hypothetical protein